MKWKDEGFSLNVELVQGSRRMFHVSINPMGETENQRTAAYKKGLGVVYKQCCRIQRFEDICHRYLLLNLLHSSMIMKASSRAITIEFLNQL